MKKLLTPLTILAFVTAHASAVVLLSEDFQSPTVGNNVGNPAFAGWTYNNGGSVKSRTEATSDLPGDSTLAPGTNQAIQFEWNTAEANYNLSHNWSASDTYTLTLNASPQAWNIHQQRYVRPTIVQTSGNVTLWDPGEGASTMMTAYGPANTYAWNGPGPYGNSDWQSEPLTQFSWTIDASTFTAGTPGENIYLKLDSSGDQRGIYIDNVNLELLDAVVIPEPASFALLGLSGLAFILRRRR